ncbi:CCA tRNA nucleotidyltransferase [Geobacter sulfurreducens]|uniref:CCA tRNA nucleotidyltransferase n=1 Tax=Geobacter sulfurreducens TaxID=35554 RepID=UPI000DBAFDA4|nr:CCA tRNA nucleotidyltransferase [Geobacter sulfurreducens]BBA70635.1 Multifunctional CCA protein [Geobacter sulfurreducens]
MDHRLLSFISAPLPSLIASLARQGGFGAWFVGGCIRDALLARPSNDIDIVVGPGGEDLPRAVAARIGGSFFPLDEERGHARVVLKGEGANCDFAPLQGGTIAADLALRDFTINALAVSCGPGDLLDPLGGAADLAQRVIRACSAGAFAADPLRIVRAYRFAAHLDFEIHAETLALIPDHAPLLATVAGERIRDELFRMLDLPRAVPYVLQMSRAGVTGAIFGADDLPADTAAGALDRVESLCRDLSAFGTEAEPVRARLRQEVQPDITIRALAKLAAFLNGAGIPADIASQRLMLGKAATRLLELLCSSARLTWPAPAAAPDSHALFTLFRHREPAGCEQLLLPLAEGILPEDRCRHLAAYLTRHHIPRGGRLLLTGDDIMTLLGLPPGRQVGEAIELLRAAQSTGEVRTRAEAQRYLAKKQLTTPEPLG